MNTFVSQYCFCKNEYPVYFNFFIFELIKKKRSEKTKHEFSQHLLLFEECKNQVAYNVYDLYFRRKKKRKEIKILKAKGPNQSVKQR